jgi:hypothetical protein
MKRLLILIAALTLPALSLGSGKASPSGADRGTGNTISLPASTGAPAAPAYALMAWSELGMHCIDGKDYSVFSVLPPYNIIHAQLLKKGEPPVAITSGVTISYLATADTTGSVNSRSASKSNFWKYVQLLFLASPPPEIGLAGYHTQSKAPYQLTYNSTEGYWEAVGIPTIPYDDKGGFNPYPMAQLVAKDSAGTVLATAKIVLSVSDEMSCKNCHASGSDPAAMPASGWVKNSDPNKDQKLNILKKHDDRWPISQYLGQLQSEGWTYQSTLYQTAVSGTPVLCAACHSDNALGLKGLAGIKPLTTDMHTLHGPLANYPSTTTLDQGKTDLTTCYVCHPGPKTLCKRGAMNQVNCSSCHGNVSHVGDTTRTGWLIEPACQMCHTNSLRYKTTFTKNGVWRQTKDQTFATNPNVPGQGADLYRYSSGHGSVFCSACHGSPHAEFPTLQPNDNVYPTTLQGYAAKITECTVCHTKLTATANGGPHGIHVIGQTWVNGHPDYVDQHGHQACAYCHGKTYRGTFLSQAKVQRVLNGKTFPAGHQFNCYDCHNGPNGGG